ncbi:hypothetical protein [Streptomyces sp. NPDC127084]|uniref:hypothetical protein n=1 Tax=Streptomyces sp. NPDC127084 TaxID=3347133 RepID=UPI00364C4BBE
MTGMTTAEWWDSLPEGVRREADQQVLRDAFILAVRTVWEAGRARGLSLIDAQKVVYDRYAHHGDRVARTPDDPLDPDSLAARASTASGRIVAIEAVWDGDTVHDWFVCLLAVTADPPGEHGLATIYRGAAEWYLEGEDTASRHPSAVAADHAGRALAARLRVPFHFGSPDNPDWEGPRWRP